MESSSSSTTPEDLLEKYTKLLYAVKGYYMSKKKYNTKLFDRDNKNSPEYIKNKKLYDDFLEEFANGPIFFEEPYCLIVCDPNTHILIFGLAEVLYEFLTDHIIFSQFPEKERNMIYKHNFDKYLELEGLEKFPKNGNYIPITKFTYMNDKGNIMTYFDNKKLLSHENGLVYSLYDKKLFKSSHYKMRTSKTFLKYPSLFEKIFDGDSEIFKLCCAYMAIYYLDIEPVKLYISSCTKHNVKAILGFFQTSITGEYSRYLPEYGYSDNNLIVVQNSKGSRAKKILGGKNSMTSFILHDQFGNYEYNGNLFDYIKTSIYLKLDLNFQQLGKVKINYNDYAEIHDYLIDCLVLLCREYELFS